MSGTSYCHGCQLDAQFGYSDSYGTVPGKAGAPDPLTATHSGHQRYRLVEMAGITIWCLDSVACLVAHDCHSFERDKVAGSATEVLKGNLARVAAGVQCGA